eukprot:4969185-Pyramimonas_sp.AAC.1
MVGAGARAAAFWRPPVRSAARGLARLRTLSKPLPVPTARTLQSGAMPIAVMGPGYLDTWVTCRGKKAEVTGPGVRRQAAR